MDNSTPVLLVIDMTNDFVFEDFNKNLALKRAKGLIPGIRELQELFLKKGFPVIFLSDRHLESDFELKKWGPHSMKGTEGSQIVDGLLTKGILTFERDWEQEDLKKARGKEPPLYEVEKGSYSGFTDNGGIPTALSSLLNKLGIGPGSSLYITGLHANCCDKHTAADAWFRGYEPVMVSDCVDSFDNTEGVLGMGTTEALAYEKYWYDARIMTSDEVKKHLAGLPVIA